MKPGTKLTLTYTAIVLAVVALSSLIIVAFVCLYFYSFDYGASFIQSIGLTISAFLFIQLLLIAAPVYFVAKSFSARLINRIDTAYHTEKTFVSNASHELNNPLTAIQGECEITLMKERTTAEYQIALQRILSETKRIILLMKSLLFLSKDDDEILRNSMEAIPLGDFLMRYSGNRVTFSTDNFAYAVNANPGMLKIAIENILNNALKYSDEEKVDIRLSGNVLEIKDYGIGIPPEELQQIAQPFFRASNTDEYEGHGVGLSLSIKILNAYGAKVTITSAVGQGTSISIEFS